MQTAQLLDVLPDKPELIDFRGLLLQRQSRLLVDDRRNFVIYNHKKQLICVCGQPDSAKIEQALADTENTADVLTLPGSKAHVAKFVPNWICQNAVIHEWTNATNVSAKISPKVRFVSKNDIELIPESGRTGNFSATGRRVRE